MHLLGIGCSPTPVRPRQAGKPRRGVCSVRLLHSKKMGHKQVIGLRSTMT